MNVDVEVLLLLSSSLIISTINMVHNIIMATNGIIHNSTVDMGINNGVQGDNRSNNSGVQVVVDMALHHNITAIQVVDIIHPNHRLHHH